MMELYKWLESRNENVICLICHWGVLDWLTGKDFKNCEVKEVSFFDIQKTESQNMSTSIKNGEDGNEIVGQAIGMPPCRMKSTRTRVTCAKMIPSSPIWFV